MKNTGNLNLLIFALLLASTSFLSCDKAKEDTWPEPLESLTDAEEADLQFLREEEKLAHDVYSYFYGKYELNIFNNIAASEQRHMDAVLAIMQEYGVIDPASDELGVFSDPSLQQLYDDLIELGNGSLVAALKVGATIEDVDIKDLQSALGSTDKNRLVDLYEKLECGSKNHMRAFVSQLTTRNETYIPQYITPEQFDAILAGQHAHCGG